MARPKIHDDQLRVRLLERAGELVAERGVAALSLRELASAESTSTTAVYSLFGGKSELIAALYAEAFTSFGAQQLAVSVTDDPIADIMALGGAYRSWALAHPQWYGAMFGSALAGFIPSDTDAQEARATIAPLAAAVGRGVASGAFSGADPMTITLAIWGVVHGLTSLELLQCLPLDAGDLEAVYHAGLRAVVRGWTRADG